MRPEQRRRILVTGALGFIGRHVVEALLRSGHEVDILVNRHVEWPGVRTVHLNDDIGSAEVWTGLTSEIGCIVHLAGRAHQRATVQTKNAELYRSINVEGTARLAAHAARRGTSRFIFASSIAVNGSTTRGRAPFGPNDDPAPKTVYGETKLAAEQALEKIRALHPTMSIDILRPPMVIGRGAPGNLAILEAALRRGLPMPVASIRNKRTFLAVNDLVDFILARIETSEIGMNRYTLATPETVSTPDFIRLMGKCMGVRPRLFSFPPSSLALLLRMVSRGDKANALTENLEIDISRALATGWKPKISLERALQEAFGSR